MIEKIVPNNYPAEKEKILEEKLKNFDAKMKQEDLERQRALKESLIKSDKKVVFISTPQRTVIDSSWSNEDKAA